MTGKPGADFHYGEDYTHEGPMAGCRDRRCRVFALTGVEAGPVPGWTDPVPEVRDLGHQRRDRGARPCICCNGIGWHESECGGRHHCLKCDGTGLQRPEGRRLDA